MRIKTYVLALVTAAALVAGPAKASLTEFATFVGAGVNVSTDGFGAIGQTGTLTANVPVGSTVLAAYLYTGLFNFGTPDPTQGNGTTLGGTAVSFGPVVANPTGCCGIASRRADVTSIVKPIIDGGPGGVYDFTVVETDEGQDGEALVVVYKAPSGPVNTVGIVDGSASVTGDTTAINFAVALDPNAPGFTAEMRLGINFSCCGQESTVAVNGTLITGVAGNNDDSIDGLSNGNLFTMGGDDDPFSTLLPSYGEDHERYNLVPQIAAGDTKITVDTANASEDDNIFVAVFLVTGEAGINEPAPHAGVPEPGTLALLGLGLLGFVVSRRRRS